VTVQPQGRLRIEDYLLLAAVLLLPWAFGGVELWAYRSAALLLASSAACALAREGGAGLGLGRGSRWLLPAALLAAWAAFQLVPLPAGVLARLSPAADALYRDTFPGYPGEAPDDLAAAVERRALDEVPEAAPFDFPPREEVLLPSEFGGRWSGWRTISLLPSAGLERLAWFVALLLGFLVVQRRCADEEIRHLYRNALFVNFLALAVFGLIYAATSNGKLYWVRELSALAHPFGPYVNPNNFGAVMELATPWLAGYAVASLRLRRPGQPWSELRAPVFVAGALLCLVAGLASASKASAVLLLVALTALGLISVRGWRARSAVVGAAVAFAAVSVVLLAETRLGERMQEFVDRIGGGAGEIDRWVGWRTSLPYFADYPLTGSGFGSFRDVFPAYMPPGELARWRQLHNDYLEVLVEGGTIAGILLAWLVLAYVLRLARSRSWRGHPEMAGLLIGLATLAVHAGFDFNHQIPANGLLFVVLAGIAASCAARPPSAEPERRGVAPVGVLLALLLVGTYGARALGGLLASGYARGRHLAAAAEFERALPYLEGAALGQDRAAALWLTAQVRLGMWHDGLAAGESPESMADLMGQAYREYTEAISLSPASGWYWAALGDIYHQRERQERFRTGFPLELLDAPPWARVGRPGRIAVGMSRIATRREPNVYTMQDQLAFQLIDYRLDAAALEVVERSARVQPVYRLHAYPDLDPAPPELLDAFARGALDALGKTPFLPRVYHLLALGRIDLRRGDPESAEKWLREALETPGTEVNRAEARFHLGRALAAEGRDEEALEMLALAGEHPAFLAASLSERARIAETAGRLEEALALLEQARIADRRRLAVALDFARVARRLGEWTRAEAALGWAVASHPGDARPVKALGMTQLEQGKLDEARRTLQQLEHFAPGSREALQLRDAVDRAVRGSGGG
jgi:tetratricopeptide (TPR) repeat protein/O-antigen ligase